MEQKGTVEAINEPSCLAHALPPFLCMIKNKKNSVANGNNSTRKSVPNMADVLKDLGSVKLRSVNRYIYICMYLYIHMYVNIYIYIRVYV